MKHVICFQKRKGLFLQPGNHSNESLGHQIAHELLAKGYIISKELFDVLVTQSEEELNNIHNQLQAFFKRVLGDGGYEPIYRGFPQSVVQIDHFEFVLNAIFHYWSRGTWRPDDAEFLEREYALETVNYTELKLLTANQYKSIFTDIVYSGSSISDFDKEIIDWRIENVYNSTGELGFDLGKIKFNETKAYIAQRLLQLGANALPTQDATLVLRTYSAYSGGDEGLKSNTRFKNPSNAQRRCLLATLEQCYNLEESFKLYREKWLKVLYYLHPMTANNRAKYPIVAEWTNKLRNNPESMKTFNGHVDDLVKQGDSAVLELLQKRPGAFTRKLDHMVRMFGFKAIEKWLELDPNVENLVTAYNHFYDRDQIKGRGAVAAGQGSSQVLTYDSLAPLDSKLVKQITEHIMGRLSQKKGDRKVYIDRALYYRPLAVNNRASSLSIQGTANGTVEVIKADKTVRMYVHWDGKHDIDLSGFLIYSDNTVDKVGWNGRHHVSSAVIYSGDNTGYANKNAEYLDIDLKKLPSNVDWIVVDARIYRGPSSFLNWSPGDVRVGWMKRSKPEANQHWLPETIEHAMKLESSATTAYLAALHVPSKNFVYLDLAMGNKIVSSIKDALKMRQYLETLVTLDDGSTTIKWNKLNQGHVIHLLNEVVDTPEEADEVFDENTTWEAISANLTKEIPVI